MLRGGSITHSLRMRRRVGLRTEKKNEDALARSARCAAMKFRLDITQKFCSNFRMRRVGKKKSKCRRGRGTQCRHYGMTAFLHIQRSPMIIRNLLKR